MRIVLVDDIDFHAQEFIDRSHPLGVALSQVGVDRNQVDALTSQRVQIDRRNSHKGFPLPRLHLRDVALVDGHPTEQLHIIGHHVPYNLGSPGLPLTTFHPATGIFGHGKRLGKQIVERSLKGVMPLLLERIQLVVETLPFGRRDLMLLACFVRHTALFKLPVDLVTISLDILQCLTNPSPEFVCLGLQLLVGQRLQFFVFGIDLVDNGPEFLDLALLAVAEDLLE